MKTVQQWVGDAQVMMIDGIMASHKDEPEGSATGKAAEK
jgi:hypothetical protein